MPCAPDLHFISLCWLKVCWSGYRITSRCCQSLFWFTESATQGVIRFKPETPSQLLKEMRGERDRGQKGELQLGMTRKQDFWRVITFRKPNVICEFLPSPCKEKKKKVAGKQKLQAMYSHGGQVLTGTWDCWAAHLALVSSPDWVAILNKTVSS